MVEGQKGRKVQKSTLFTLRIDNKMLFSTPINYNIHLDINNILV